MEQGRIKLVRRVDHKWLQQGNDTMLHSWSFPGHLSNFDITMSHMGPLPFSNAEKHACHLNVTSNSDMKQTAYCRIHAHTGRYKLTLMNVCVFPCLSDCTMCVFWVIGPGAWNRWSARCLKDRRGDLGLRTAQGHAGCFSVHHYMRQSTNGHLLLKKKQNKTITEHLVSRKNPNNYFHRCLDFDRFTDNINYSIEWMKMTGGDFKGRWTRNANFKPFA